MPVITEEQAAEYERLQMEANERRPADPAAAAPASSSSSSSEEGYLLGFDGVPDRVGVRVAGTDENGDPTETTRWGRIRVGADGALRFEAPQAPEGGTA